MYKLPSRHSSQSSPSISPRGFFHKSSGLHLGVVMQHLGGSQLSCRLVDPRSDGKSGRLKTKIGCLIWKWFNILCSNIFQYIRIYCFQISNYHILIYSNIFHWFSQDIQDIPAICWDHQKQPEQKFGRQDPSGITFSKYAGPSQIKIEQDRSR